MKRSSKITIWMSGLTLALTAMVCSAAKLTVVTTNSPPGYYSWTLTRGDEDWIWGIGNIQIQTYGVTNIYTPANWSVSNNAGYITWKYTNGTWFIHNTGVTFAVESVFTNSTTYSNNPGTDFFPQARINGKLYDTNHTPPGVSFSDSFVLIGPRPMPTLTTYSISNGSIYVDIEEMLGRTGYLERSYNLISNVWQETTNFTVQGLSTNLTDTLPAGTNSAFYRLRFTR